MSEFCILKSREFTAGLFKVEQASSIKPTTGSPYGYAPLMCLPIGDLLAGDVIDVATCSAQVSSKMPYNLMVASVLIVTDQPITTVTRSAAEWGNCFEVTEAVGQNITNNVHHYPIQRSARYTMQVDLANAHLVFLVYCASTAYDGTSLVTVDQDYGRLEGTVERPATTEDLLALLGTSAPPAPAETTQTATPAVDPLAKVNEAIAALTLAAGALTPAPQA